MTNSKKIKRNIGASLRLAPFGHVRSITFTIMLLAVALIFGCRKSGGGGGITQTDPIKNLTGNLLIVSADGTKGANSLPLSFVGASATVSDVKVDKFGGQGGDILLFPTNFIIENGNLYLTNNLTTTNKDGGEVKAAVSNKVTLTFSLSGENLSRYTDTAEIFVGKYSNIYTNQYIGFTNLAKIAVNDMMNIPNYAVQDTEFDFTTITNATTNETILILENTLKGNNASKVDTQKFIGVVSNRMYTNSIGNFTNYYNSFFVSFDTNDSESIAKFKIDFTPKALYNDTNKSYYLIFYLKEGKWDNLGK